MLESLARKKQLAPAPAPRFRSRSAFTRAAYRSLFEFSRCLACALLSTVKRVTEHSGDGGLSTQKMHLETVRLLLRARLGVNAADIWFRIWI
jgi:hypothetical protein